MIEKKITDEEYLMALDFARDSSHRDYSLLLRIATIAGYVNQLMRSAESLERRAIKAEFEGGWNVDPRHYISREDHDKEISQLKKRVQELEKYVRRVANDFDCDKDAHRHDTPCRACDAQKLIGMCVNLGISKDQQ